MEESQYNHLDRRVHLDNPYLIRMAHVGYMTYHPRERGLPHRYPYWVLSYLGDAGAYFTVDEQEVYYPPDTLLLVPPYISHDVRRVEGQKDMHLIYFGVDADLPLVSAPIFEINVQVQKLPQYASFKHFLKGVSAECSVKCNVELLKAHLPELFAHTVGFCNAFSKAHQDEHKSASPQSRKQIETIRKILLENLGGNLTLVDLGKEMFFSPRYLSGVLRKNSGMNFAAYYKMLKMEYAYTQLTTTDITISQLSDELGYCNVQHFSNQFKSYFGTPPGVVRRMRR